MSRTGAPMGWVRGLCAITLQFAGRMTSVQSRVRCGHPASEIVAEAREHGADLIVMATHGRTGLARLLAGSVASSVMRRAPIPVLVMRLEEGGEPRGGGRVREEEGMRALRIAWGRGSMIVAGVVLLLFGAGCAAGDPATDARAVVVEGGGSYMEVEAPALAQMLARKDFTLINVHVPYEGEIEGTDVSVPFDRIGDHLDRLSSDRSAKLVVYCRSGRMSAIAAREMVARGYTNVWDLSGGMIAWARAGYAIVGAGR